MNKENVETNSRYKYCRRLMEVEAVKVSRGNLEKIVKFTGMGDLRFVKGINPFEKDRYFLVGSCFNVPEGWYFVKYQTGKIELMNPREFKSVFEPKDFIDKNTFDHENMFERMNELFGKDIKKRFRKLTEEYNELLQAMDFWVNGKKPKDNSDVIDELADLNAVLFHIAGLFGYTQEQLLEMAYNKIVGRQVDPNYMRKHPHKSTSGNNEVSCGNCASFTCEDMNGDGYCETCDAMRNCKDLACHEWKSKEANQQYKHFEERFNKKV